MSHPNEVKEIYGLQKVKKGDTEAFVQKHFRWFATADKKKNSALSNGAGNLDGKSGCFDKLFWSLPFATLVNDTVFVVHGGIPHTGELTGDLPEENRALRTRGSFVDEINTLSRRGADEDDTYAAAALARKGSPFRGMLWNDLDGGAGGAKGGSGGLTYGGEASRNAHKVYGAAFRAWNANTRTAFTIRGGESGGKYAECSVTPGACPGGFS